MEKSLSMTEFQHNWVWNTALTNSTVMAVIYFFACVLRLSHKKSWQTKIIHNRIRGAGVFDQWEDFYNSMWALYSKHICKLVKDEKISSVLVSQNGLIITICLCLWVFFTLELIVKIRTDHFHRLVRSFRLSTKDREHRQPISHLKIWRWALYYLYGSQLSRARCWISMKQGYLCPATSELIAISRV